MCFHALEEVFDKMALGVALTVKGLRLLIESLETFARNRAASGPMSHKLLAEGQAVEAFVTHQMRATKGLEHQTRGGEVMEVASAQHEVTEQAVLIDGGQQLGGHPSSRQPDGLLLTPRLRTLEAVLMELDVAAINMPPHTPGFFAEPYQQRVPYPAEAPASEL